MAICIPPPEIIKPTSKAEARLYAALCEQLDDEFLVLHSVAWISKPRGQGPRDGEADFIIAHPRLGLLIVEVKGGEVSLDYGRLKWTSRDKGGVVHDIKNPFEQARTAKFSALEKLQESPIWLRLKLGRITLAHAAFMPDIDNGQRLAGPDAPPVLIGDRGNMNDLTAWVTGVFGYWRGEAGAGTAAMGPNGVDAVRQIFARVVSTRALLSTRLHEEEQQRIELTQRQAAILDVLSRQRKAMIAGGAGTGKTLIAREKAIRLAREGMRTLLVCYNRGLADFLREQSQDVEGLDVAGFHQLANRWIERAKAEKGRDLLAEVRRKYPKADRFNQQEPAALAEALDLFGPQYDAIVVDEAQDFGDDYWLPIEMLFTKPDESLLYVFLDENQGIYRRSAVIPVNGEPFVLDSNCRNTGRIHEAAYRYYRGEAVTAPQNEGVVVETLPGAGLDRQAGMIAQLVTRLVAEEHIAPHDIGILVTQSGKMEACAKALAALPIPKSVDFGRIEDYAPGVVIVDTVARFKGLERAVIILWGFDDSDPVRDREILYVGLSRAKSVLVLCGTAVACEKILSPPTTFG
ncbi:MAG: AAA family ATPase [Caulobacter sp.]|nr:AAA family ATPase [Caulobacter sp.]